MYITLSSLDPQFKSKWTNPYDYDPIIQFIGKGEANASIYTDRLLQWDSKRHDELCVKHFGNEGQNWDRREPKKIEAFLRDWCDDQKLKLTQVIEYCNVSNGYPTWRLDYFKPSEKRTEPATMSSEIRGALGTPKT